MGRFQEGADGTGLSPHIKRLRPVHRGMAENYVLGTQSPTALAQIYGYTSGQVSRIIGSPAFIAEVNRLQRAKEIIAVDIAKDLKLMQEKALEVIDQDLELDPNTLEERKVRQNAALKVLGLDRANNNVINIHSNIDNRSINVGEMSDQDIRDEILELTKNNFG